MIASSNTAVFIWANVGIALLVSDYKAQITGYWKQETGNLKPA
jgi:hypothetical protein